MLCVSRTTSSQPRELRMRPNAERGKATRIHQIPWEPLVAHPRVFEYPQPRARRTREGTRYDEFKPESPRRRVAFCRRPDTRRPGRRLRMVHRRQGVYGPLCGPGGRGHCLPEGLCLPSRAGGCLCRSAGSLRPRARHRCVCAARPHGSWLRVRPGICRSSGSSLLCGPAGRICRGSPVLRTSSPFSRGLRPRCTPSWTRTPSVKIQSPAFPPARCSQHRWVFGFELDPISGHTPGLE